MSRFFLALFATLSFTLLGVLFTGSSVSAASIYDDAYQTTNKLRLTGTWYGIDEDISADWVQFILQDWPYDNMSPTLFRTGSNLMTEQEKQDMRDSWHNAHNWAVSNHCWFSGSDEFCDVYVYWSESPLSLTWYENGVTVTNLDYNVRISQNSGSNPSQTRTEVQVRSVSTEYISRIDINETFNFIAFVDDPNYPQDYEGEEFNETHILPLNNSPKISVVSSVDWKITLQDENFITLGEWAFTCNNGFPPIIQYELYNNDTDPITEIDSGELIPTFTYTFQAEDYGVETEFRFIAIYNCGTGSEEPSFSKQTNFTFSVNSEGIFVLPTDSCFTETFPYVDLNGCMSVVSSLVNNLSFGTISLPNWSIQSDNCHTLGTMGDWLNVPNHSRTICPQFSEEVRSIVTPFLTFVLGITIMGALVNKSSKDTH